MERLAPNQSEIISPFTWATYKANSLADMENSKESIASELEANNQQWFNNLNWRRKIDNLSHLSLFTLDSSNSFTYIKLNKFPHPWAAPRALVLLNNIQHYPALDETSKPWLIKVSDLTGTKDIEFPYGVTADTGKALGFQASRETLKETSWINKSIILLNVYSPWPRSFLMHVFNIKETEKAEAKLRQFSPKLTLLQI